MLKVENKRSDDFYKQVAILHATNINLGFLASLGERFLILLYEAMDQDSQSILIVEYKEHEIVGFVSGGVGMHSVYKQLLWRWPRVLLALIPVVFSLQKMKSIVDILLFSRGGKRLENCPRAELFSIAVDEKVRGQGVAQRLYTQLSERFQQAGVEAFCIVVGDDLTPAHRFYKNQGAYPIGHVYVHGDAGSVVYRQNLLSQDARP